MRGPGKDENERTAALTEEARLSVGGGQPNGLTREREGDEREPPTALADGPRLPDRGVYDGPTRSAPYGLTRLAPAYSLVDVAAEIERADTQLATVTTGKLSLIAEQIRALQERARGLMDRAQRDAKLHRVRCNFEKKPGGIYHLYERADGTSWFSLFAPDEWTLPQAQTFRGSYRLEMDMSFSRIDERESAEVAGEDAETMRALLAMHPR